MLWKIYNIHTDKVLKAGFDDEDIAKEWLDVREHLAKEDYLIEEMDIDEEEDYLELQRRGEDADEIPESQIGSKIDEDPFDGGADDDFGDVFGGDDGADVEDEDEEEEEVDEDEEEKDKDY